MDFEAAKAYILHRLEHELDTRLVYHSYSHTVDVFQATCELSIRENIGEEDQRLVETAALYHDAGMLIAYENHEENSIKMAADILRKFNYTSNQIGVVCDLIRCTKLPQLASATRGNILCDADLDYLGRDDFFVNSFRLKLEWQFFHLPPPHPSTPQNLHSSVIQWNGSGLPVYVPLFHQQNGSPKQIIHDRN